MCLALSPFGGFHLMTMTPLTTQRMHTRFLPLEQVRQLVHH
jgi:hypothetical protein